MGVVGPRFIGTHRHLFLKENLVGVSGLPRAIIEDEGSQAASVAGVFDGDFLAF